MGKSFLCDTVSKGDIKNYFKSAEINSNIFSIYNKRIKRTKKTKKDEKGVAFKSIGDISYEE